MSNRGISRKHRINNYRVEKFKVNKLTNVCAVEVSCYCNTSHFKSFSTALRRLNSNSNRNIVKLKDKGLEQLIQYNEISEVTFVNGMGFSTFGCQFTLPLSNKKMTEPVWVDVIDNLIEIIESSNYIVIDK